MAIDVAQNVKNEVSGTNLPGNRKPKPVDFSNTYGVQRLTISLSPLQTGKGVNAVFTNRYLYLYPEYPNIVFASTSPLRGDEVGIPAYRFDLWTAGGVVPLDDDNLHQAQVTELNTVREGLTPSDVFQAVAGSNPLPVLVATKYINMELMASTFRHLSEIKGASIELARVGRIEKATDKELSDMGLDYGITALSLSPAKSANPGSVDSNPVVPPYKQSDYVPDEIPASQVTVNTSYETVGGDMGLDGNAGEVNITPNPDIATARAENEALHDSQPVAAVGEAVEAVDSNPVLTRPAKPAKSNGKVPA